MARDPRQGELFKKRKGFFAVDHRTWKLALSLGSRHASAYLVMARGTLSDMRTVSWSATSIAKYVGVHWYGARGVIEALISAGLVRQDRGGERPRYTLAAAHEVPGCIAPPQNSNVVRLRPVSDTSRPKPEWIWLPNELVDGLPLKDGDAPRPPDQWAPLRQVQSTGRIEDLRLLIDLYRYQALETCGGVPWTEIRIEYKRTRLGQRGPYTVWGFIPGRQLTDNQQALPRSYLTGRIVEIVRDGKKRREDEGWSVFWGALKRLEAIGLVGFVPHLITGDLESDPRLLFGPGFGGDLAQPEERRLGRAAEVAGMSMLTAAQQARAHKALVVPIKHHLADVQVVGVLRLRFKTHASKTAEWLSSLRETNYWLQQFEAITVPEAIDPRRHQRIINGSSRDRQTA